MVEFLFFIHKCHYITTILKNKNMKFETKQNKGYVQTVTGPVERLGHTQCHEHIYLRKGPSYECNAALCMDDYFKSLKELRDYRTAGGGTIVDAQPGFFGRDADILKRLSSESDVQIIGVTGFHKLQFMEKESPLLKMSRDELMNLFISEIRIGMLEPYGATKQDDKCIRDVRTKQKSVHKTVEELCRGGIYETDGIRSTAKAGIVKLAYEKDGWKSPEYKILFEAAADAAAITGVPVMVHTEKGNDLIGLLAFLSAHQVIASRVLICHLDRTNTDIDYHKRLLRTGCYLCYDSVHRYKYVTDEQEISLLKEMCEAGYGEQIALSLDTTNERLRAYNANDMGLDYILTDFIPMLRQAGVAKKDIRAMCESNAGRILQVQEVAR